MAKTARKASSKRTIAKKNSGFGRPTSSGSQSAYWRIRQRIEEMYALHLLLLVVMSSLGAAMFVIVVNQRIQIQNLEFKLDFVNDRYAILRQRDQLAREKADAEDAGVVLETGMQRLP